MRSKHALNYSADGGNPFIDWDLDGGSLTRRSSEPLVTETATEEPSPNEAFARSNTPTHAAPQEADNRRAVMRLQVAGAIGRWLLLGILGGAVMGGLVGLMAGPIGSAIGFAVGGILGAVSAVTVVVLAGISYTVRYLAGRPAETASQHVITWIVPPAVLLSLPLFFDPAGLIVTGPALLVGLFWGPSVVRKSLRPVYIPAARRTQEVASPGSPRGPSRATPTHTTTDSTPDSPQEVI